jgi:hypothetical protein
MRKTSIIINPGEIPAFNKLTQNYGYRL